jgi:hypothetical protein
VISRQTISTITDKVIDGMLEWQSRPLDRVYPVIFLDRVHARSAAAKVAIRPIYVAFADAAPRTPSLRTRLEATREPPWLPHRPADAGQAA